MFCVCWSCFLIPIHGSNMTSRNQDVVKYCWFLISRSMFCAAIVVYLPIYIEPMSKASSTLN
jgi:hypothetical protein